MSPIFKVSGKPVSVLVLGGAGAMGQVVVETIQNFPSVGKVVIADLDEKRAQCAARGLSDKVSAMRADGLDHNALVDILQSYDYVISTLGPFYLFGRRVLSAAIEARTDYIDICDDWEPTLELLELHDEAKSAGIRALIGAGASPGISNMLAVKAIANLDSAHTLYTGWGATSLTEEDEIGSTADMAGTPAAAVEHWVQQFSGEITVQEDGAYVSQPPLQKHILPHPEGGRCDVYTLGHPEPVTFPRYFPSIQNSYNVMDMPDFLISIMKSLKRQIDSEELDIRGAATYLEMITSGSGQTMRMADSARGAYHTIREVLRRKKYMPALHATAMGVSNGREEVCTVWMNGKIPGGMGSMTCIPTAVFLLMMIEGNISETGVYPPEAHADPDTFFEKLGPYIEKEEQSAPILRFSQTERSQR